MESELLIEAVRKRVPLWDQKHKYHNNRHVNQKLWKEISKEMGANADFLRKKWKGLKDVFRKEMKKQAPGKSGANLHTSRWVFYDSLLFLSNQMKTKDKSGIMSISHKPKKHEEIEVAGPSQPAGICSTPESTFDPNSFAMEDGDGVDELDDGNLSSASSDAPNISKLRGQRDQAKKRRRDETSKLCELEKKLSLLKGCCNQGKSDDYHFLMSFLPHIEGMTLEKKMLFRVKMQELLYTTLFLSESTGNNDV